MKNLTMLSGAGIRTSDSNHKGKQRQIKRRLDPRPSVALVFSFLVSLVVKIKIH